MYSKTPHNQPPWDRAWAAKPFGRINQLYVITTI